jgi:hypothetical protein
MYKHDMKSFALRKVKLNHKIIKGTSSGCRQFQAKIYISLSFISHLLFE